MTEGFWSGLTQHLLFWAGWVFTVGGAIVSLSLGREYAWIGALCIVVGFLSLTTFAYKKHRQHLEASRQHDVTHTQLQSDLQTSQLRAEHPEHALQHLRQDDPFVLEFKDANSLLTRRAYLRVHQLEQRKEILWFKVLDSFTSDEMAHVDALAEKQDVPAKGYAARPICDANRYASLDVANMITVLRLLIQDMLHYPEIEP